MKFNTNLVKHINIPDNVKKLKITGTDGNAFALMGRAQEHNRKHKIYSRTEFAAIMSECTSSDYDHLLATLMHFFGAY